MRTYRLSDVYPILEQTDPAAARVTITEGDDGVVEVMSPWMDCPGKASQVQKRVRMGETYVDVEMRRRTELARTGSWRRVARLGEAELGSMVPMCLATRSLAAVGVATSRALHSPVAD